MNEQRLAVVKHAWQFLDDANQRRVSYSKLASLYNLQGHPRVRTREKKAETVQKEFETCMGGRV